MATFLDTEGFRKKEVKLDEWKLPTVMVRELSGAEAENLRDYVAGTPGLTENAMYRRVVAMGCINPTGVTEDALLKVSASAVRHIAKQIQELGAMGAEASEKAEKN